jgi:predicted nucleic acid-binding protein
MSVFVDTSALLAVLHGSDAHHARAARIWRTLAERDTDLVSSNYVLIETTALLQSRFGLAAVRDLADTIAPLLRVAFVTEDVHASAVAALLAANRRQLSLVDCVSFVTMRRLSVTRAFAFDPHFAEQGFELVQR